MTVTLRRAGLDDLAFLVALVADEETRPYLGNRAADTEEKARADIERSQREPDAYGWFVIEVDGEPAGCVAYERTNERHRIAEGGRFAIHPGFRGRHVGVEAARAFQRLVLRELGFHRLELLIYGFNERAIAHARRSGYVEEGTRRRAFLKDGEWVDAVMFALTEEDLDE